MKDLEIEYYLALLAILGIELYSSNTTKTNKTNNNVLKGGKAKMALGAVQELTKMKDKDAAKKAFDSRNWKSDAAKSAAKNVGKGIGEGASVGLKGVENTGEYIKNLINPSWIVVTCLIIGCVVFILFMGAPSILIISLLVASWYFLRNQINRYFPAVDSNPVMKSNNQNQNQN